MNNGSLDDFGQVTDTPINDGYTAVAAGWSHSHALREDGSITSWGINSSGLSCVSALNEGFVMVDAGKDHVIGLKEDGTILVWGSNYYDEWDAPLADTPFTYISSGTNHCFAIDSIGVLAAWGRNDEGQCELPSPNTGFIAASGGVAHSIALRDDGSIEAWGANNYGQCQIPSPNSNYIAIASGDFHNLALRSNGEVVAWGSNSNDQCDVPNLVNQVISLDAGYSHSLAIVTPQQVQPEQIIPQNECNIYEGIEYEILCLEEENNDGYIQSYVEIKINGENPPANELIIDLSDYLYLHNFSRSVFVSIEFFSSYPNAIEHPYCITEYMANGNRSKTIICDPTAWNLTETPTSIQSRYFPEPKSGNDHDYWISATVDRIGYREFNVKIESNLHGMIVLSTGLAKKGLNPDDTFVGTDFQRVQMWGGTVNTFVDGTFRILPFQTELPPGEYWLEIRFHPNWQGNRAIAQLLRVSDIIEENVSVVIE